jgi:endonuclease-3
MESPAAGAVRVGRRFRLRQSAMPSSPSPRRRPDRRKNTAAAAGDDSTPAGDSLPPLPVPAGPPKSRHRAERVGQRRARAARIDQTLEECFPGAECELDYASPFQLLVATILSAQCTDARVNMTTPALFARFPDAAAMAGAEPGELEELIRPTGFFRNKSKSLLAASRDIVASHGGEVPGTMAELTQLAGVGRKTANVVLGNAFNVNDGIAVDTHVNRLSQRLALTRESTPEKIEADLMKLIPRERWTGFSHRLILHGRRVCRSRKPACADCRIADLCPSRTAIEP